MIDPNNELSTNALLNVLALSANATAIYTGPVLRIQFVNDAMLAFWGKDRSITGKTVEEALPELASRPYHTLLQQVWSSGEGYIGKDIPATLELNKRANILYFDLEFRPIKNPKGETYCILHIAADVTERVTYKQLAREKQDLAQQLNDKLTAANEEMTSLNEELAVTNEELNSLNEEIAVSNEELSSLNEEYLVTNEELNSLNEEYNAANEQLHLLNDRYLQLNDQLYITNTQLTVINDERQTLNEELNATNEELATVNDERLSLNEELTATNEELRSLNEIYLSLNDKVNITLETANLAKTAANLGTFDLDVINDKLDWDDRCKELFGLNPAVEVTYSDDFVKGLHPEDKKRVLKAVANAYSFDLSEGNYDIGYRTIGAEDKILRWVRAIGKVLFNAAKQPVRFIGTVMDITEQKEDEQRKNDFIGMVSHELKTPLTSLSAYLQVLLGRANKAEDTFTLNALDKSFSQVKKMTAMINGFLNTSRLESGKIQIDKEEFDMAKLVKDVEEESRAITSHKLIFAPVEQTITIADKDKIALVITNFISNAVKYSPKDSTIHIACVTLNGRALVSVKDHGMGIAQQNIEKLFDRYYRVEGDLTKSISGFGLGLYLCSEIIKRHGGEIGVESEVNKGSNFWFSLPLGKE